MTEGEQARVNHHIAPEIVASTSEDTSASIEAMHGAAMHGSADSGTNPVVDNDAIKNQAVLPGTRDGDSAAGRRVVNNTPVQVNLRPADEPGAAQSGDLGQHVADSEHSVGAASSSGQSRLGGHADEVRGAGDGGDGHSENAASSSGSVIQGSNTYIGIPGLLGRLGLDDAEVQRLFSEILAIKDQFLGHSNLSETSRLASEVDQETARVPGEESTLDDGHADSGRDHTVVGPRVGTSEDGVLVWFDGDFVAEAGSKTALEPEVAGGVEHAKGSGADAQPASAQLHTASASVDDRESQTLDLIRQLGLGPDQIRALLDHAANQDTSRHGSASTQAAAETANPENASTAFPIPGDPLITATRHEPKTPADLGLVVKVDGGTRRLEPAVIDTSRLTREQILGYIDGHSSRTASIAKIVKIIYGNYSIDAGVEPFLRELLVEREEAERHYADFARLDMAEIESTEMPVLKNLIQEGVDNGEYFVYVVGKILAQRQEAITAFQRAEEEEVRAANISIHLDLVASHEAKGYVADTPLGNGLAYIAAYVQEGKAQALDEATIASLSERDLKEEIRAEYLGIDLRTLREAMAVVAKHVSKDRPEAIDTFKFIERQINLCLLALADPKLQKASMGEKTTVVKKKHYGKHKPTIITQLGDGTDRVERAYTFYYHDRDFVPNREADLPGKPRRPRVYVGNRLSNLSVYNNVGKNTASAIYILDGEGTGKAEVLTNSSGRVVIRPHGRIDELTLELDENTAGVTIEPGEIGTVRIINNPHATGEGLKPEPVIFEGTNIDRLIVSGVRSSGRLGKLENMPVVIEDGYIREVTLENALLTLQHGSIWALTAYDGSVIQIQDGDLGRGVVFDKSDLSVSGDVLYLAKPGNSTVNIEGANWGNDSLIRALSFLSESNTVARLGDLVNSRRNLTLQSIINECKTALQMYPDSTGILNQQARAYLRYGYHKEAADLFKRVLSLGGGDEKIHYELGLALNKLGKTGEALIHFNEYLDTARRQADRERINEQMPIGYYLSPIDNKIRYT